ncbi:MAG: hypothetical protein ACI9MF_002806, partial [Gammaproteobacteria bacterium]
MQIGIGKSLKHEPRCPWKIFHPNARQKIIHQMAY